MAHRELAEINATVFFRPPRRSAQRLPLTCGTSESRYHQARGAGASGRRCRQVQAGCQAARHYRMSMGALAVSIVSGHPKNGWQWLGSIIWTSTSRLAGPNTIPGTFVVSFHSKYAPGASRKRCWQPGRSTTCAETPIGSLPSVSLSGTIRTFRDRPRHASMERRPELCTRNRSGVSSPTTTVDGITSDKVRASRNCERTRRACSERAAHPELQIAMNASAKAATDRIDTCRA